MMVHTEAYVTDSVNTPSAAIVIRLLVIALPFNRTLVGHDAQS